MKKTEQTNRTTTSSSTECTTSSMDHNIDAYHPVKQQNQPQNSIMSLLESEEMMADGDDGRFINVWGKHVASTDLPPLEAPDRKKRRKIHECNDDSAIIAPPFESVLGSTDTFLSQDEANFLEDILSILPEHHDHLLDSTMDELLEREYIFGRDLLTPLPFSPEAVCTKKAPESKNEVTVTSDNSPRSMADITVGRDVDTALPSLPVSFSENTQDEDPTHADIDPFYLRSDDSSFVSEEKPTVVTPEDLLKVDANLSIPYFDTELDDDFLDLIIKDQQEEFFFNQDLRMLFPFLSEAAFTKKAPELKNEVSVTPDNGHGPRNMADTTVGRDVNTPPSLPVSISEKTQVGESTDNDIGPSSRWTGDRFSASEENPTIVAREDILDIDIYSGREYRGSKHYGNLKYQAVIRAKKRTYQGLTNSHKKKTEMTRNLLENVILGRFVGRRKNGVFFLSSEEEARKKIRQALSEKKSS
jgi:hypothetical protein